MHSNYKKPTCDEANKQFKKISSRWIVYDIGSQLDKNIKPMGYPQVDYYDYYWCYSNCDMTSCMTSKGINVPEGYNNILQVGFFEMSFCYTW
jgi:hypothetical protein